MGKTTCALLALCALAALADDPEPDATKAELKKLKGTWAIIKVADKGGERLPTARLTYTFEGETLIRRGPAGKGKPSSKQIMTVKIDTKKKPHTITLMRQVANKPMVHQVGVFKIEKGLLHLALGRPGGAAAPKDFSGGDHVAYVMRREKEMK